MTPRLFTDTALTPGALIDLDADRAHYLRDVLRLQSGAAVMLFNGRDGEWRSAIQDIRKRGITLHVEAQIRHPVVEPDLWLCFAPIKKARLDFIAEKATELGVRRLQPVITQHTNVERVNIDRLRANATEAAEQTERLTVPEVVAPMTLPQLVAGWPADRHVLLADETGGGRPVADVLAGLDEAARTAPWAVLTGPEGGFARSELDLVGRLAHVHAVGLGPRILRADTAALAALAVWQAIVGDWRQATPRRWPDYATSAKQA
ncbi:MAG TPA: 16S rRNA (uracil(1498)-N(3))-methyltransferase [Vineibacter sp.]|nr:16S rRNA (uracil(1498)-N(3))-methyltransferase [Vineibacter sp.]